MYYIKKIMGGPGRGSKSEKKYFQHFSINCIPNGILIRVREIHLSIAGHFVQRTSRPLLDILNSCRTFHCKLSGNIKLFA